MVYVLATIKVEPGKMQEFLDTFWNQYLPLTDKICAENRVGRKLVAQWQTTVGRLDEVVDLWAYDDLMTLQRYREVRLNSEEFRKHGTAIRALISEEVLKVIVPTPHSPLK